MRWILAVLLGLMAVACTAVAQPEQEPAADEQAAELDPTQALLGRLEKRGRQLDAYQASVQYTREQALLGDKQVRIGRVTYHAADAEADRPARFAIHFTHAISNDRLDEQPRSFVFDGTWLAEVDWKRRTFIRRQIVADGERYDPLQLGKGPFPLPLGQHREQVNRLFEPTLVEPTDADPEGTVHLRLTPRQFGEEGERLSEFARVDIWYDRQSLLPRQIVTRDNLDAEMANITTVVLRKPVTGMLPADADKSAFDTTPPAGGGWDVTVNALKDADAQE